MSTQNPLVPEGSLPTKSKSNVRIAIFTILAIHVVLIGGLLMQGCKREAKVDTTATSAPTDLAPMTTPTDTTSTPLPGDATTTPTTTPLTATASTATTATPPTTAATTTAPAPMTATPLPTTPTTVAAPIEPAPIAPAASETVHAVAKNESFSTIAKKYHVSVKAIQDANPNVNPVRLQIGQKLNIPATAAKVDATATATADAAADASVYVVKSGDALEKIARANGTSVKAIKALNGMKTDRIVVGQKLKMPAAKAPAAVEPASATNEVPAPGGVGAVAVPATVAPIQTAKNTH